LICLAACYWINDVKLHRGLWTRPFVIFGSNAIAVYVLADLISVVLSTIRVQFGHRTVTLQECLYRHLFGQIPSRALASLAYSLAFVLVCFLPIWWMYRKRIFLKV